MVPVQQPVSQKKAGLREFASYVLRFAGIILAGALIFYIDQREFFDPLFTAAFVTVLAFGKTVYFIRSSYDKILEVTVQNIAYHKFLLFIVVNISMVVVSFGADYFCIMQVNEKSFVGFAPQASTAELAFDCFYFSALNFSVFGFGEILPRTIPAKLLVLMEVVISFLTIIFILSDFISLKESLQRARTLEEEDNNE
jgi:hypothetical protein